MKHIKKYNDIKDKQTRGYEVDNIKSISKIFNKYNLVKESINWTFDDEEEEEDILTNPIFVKFLINNNAYTSFIENLKNEKYNGSLKKKYKSIESFCDDIQDSDYLYFSFLWRLTPEKFEYWEELNSDWINIIL